MAQDKSKKVDDSAKEGGSWLKLPKIWTDTGDKPADETDDNGIEPGGGSTADDPLVRESKVTASKVDPETQALLARESANRDQQTMLLDLESVKSEMERMHHIINELNERESSMEQVFNTLHTELMDYKKDFIYEHLKPVVRPLLFLFDSLEQFDREIELYERPNTDERRHSGLAPRLVRENIGYFREQLVEALRICEVTLMETPSGTFNSKLHKAIDVAPVEEAQDNQIIRVVRAGWYLNNQVLRPAEVVIGKAVPKPRDEKNSSSGAQSQAKKPAAKEDDADSESVTIK